MQPHFVKEEVWACRGRQAPRRLLPLFYVQFPVLVYKKRMCFVERRKKGLKTEKKCGKTN